MLFRSTEYSWSEASDRMIYVAQNFYQQDTGSVPQFGDTFVVFDTEYVRTMVLMAPWDTGMLHMSGCDADSEALLGQTSMVQEVDVQGFAPPGQSINCSAWNGAVGTLDYHNHLILANFDIHADESKSGSTRLDYAKAFFQRSAFAGSYTDLPTLSTNGYWESNIVGNPRTKAVKFLIGSFPELFGTDDGRRLQQVAEELSLPLAWAMGSGAGGSGPGPKLMSSGPGPGPRSPVPGNRRLLDPSLSLTNASLPANAASAFEELWQTAVTERAAGSVSNSSVESWWASLLESQVRLAPLTARACSERSGCIGTNTATDDCVCRSSILVV